MVELLKKLFPGRDFQDAGGVASRHAPPQGILLSKLMGYFVVVKLLSLADSL